jgi:glutamate-5-semialdehyde dehydrogenase
MSLNNIGEKAKSASYEIAKLNTNQKNEILLLAADDLERDINLVLLANREDVENAKINNLKSSFIDRLTLNKTRIKEMANGLRQVATLDDPVNEVINMKTLENGLQVGLKRVPMGVIAIIFEARPNVTSDAFGLCLKAGSASILRGGKEAISSNTAIINIFKTTLKELGYNQNFTNLIEDTSHETANELMKLDKYVDVLIPRGSGRLIQTVKKNSTVPVIETGVGNCHVYVDESAKLDDALNIIINSKTQRVGVCNACESLLIHKSLQDKFMNIITKELQKYNVEVRGDKNFQQIEGVIPATTEDYATEYNDYIISAKVVDSLDEAIDHIRKYSTGHSESIVTENYTNAQRFLNEVDSACVYVNASTRFTDGFQFGFGAEIGISTQKLHARGPMGLKELTSTKYIIYGNGQIRD